jgi:hypothetical protein
MTADMMLHLGGNHPAAGMVQGDEGAKQLLDV